ncbi:MAG: hypothetical protein RLZ14_1718 [Actinomycetota bacterium]
MPRTQQADEAHDTHGRTGNGRIDALSDGVFAVALTLLTFDVVAASKEVPEGISLAQHLRHQWPTFVAFLIGFMTILVCWINHHCVYGYVRRSTPVLLWVNGLQLALVSIVPFPTSVLASNIDGSANDRRTALLVYGTLFWLIATSFWMLWRYVTTRGLADVNVDPVRARGMGVNYMLSSVWTVLCLVVASMSVFPALVMWALMFIVFASPNSFARFTGARVGLRATEPAGGAA